MGRFQHKIGDKVLSLSTTESEYAQPRLKGEVYIVSDISSCSNCGIDYINTGSIEKKMVGKCTACQSEQDTKGLKWTPSLNYANINDKEQLKLALDQAIEVEDYSLAIIIRDINKQYGKNS